MPEALVLRGEAVLVLHAHPDDEAIFTGLTIRRLVEAGARVVLAVTTLGERGHCRVRLAAGETLPMRRTIELERAATVLGVARLVLLGRRDSGVTRHPTALCGRLPAADDTGLVHYLAGLAEAESASALIHYDRTGIYGHPDHVVVHRVGAAAAALAGITGYQATVDRDDLQQWAPDGHVLHAAIRATSEASWGAPSDEIDVIVEGTADEVSVKRAAIAAHVSQVAPEQLGETSRFTAAYGKEWFVREGPSAAVDVVASRSRLAIPRGFRSRALAKP